jgi:hypothetical protein
MPYPRVPRPNCRLGRVVREPRRAKYRLYIERKNLIVTEISVPETTAEDSLDVSRGSKNNSVNHFETAWPSEHQTIRIFISMHYSRCNNERPLKCYSIGFHRKISLGRPGYVD